MAEHLSLNQVNDLLTSEQTDITDPFLILKTIASNLNQQNSALLQEVILRILEKRSFFSNYEHLVNDFARHIGLFPYLKREDLNIADQIAYEYHRPDGIRENNIVFHRVQAQVYFKLLEGKNVILSAPTSFGKSLIIDTLIASEKYKNIVIVLPTIALIDETRRRLIRFKDSYKVITHTSQRIEDKNIFILTQERVIEIINNIHIDFFVIDEFYKIQPSSNDKERSLILNHAFYKLLKDRGQFYLLGPDIRAVDTNIFPGNSEVIFIKSDYKTVVTEKELVKKGGLDPLERLLELCKSLQGEPTLIYCASPKSANKVSKFLLDSGHFQKDNKNDEAVRWLKKEYHPKWYLPKALEHGIGIHHGRIPRSIAQYAVRSFNDEKINFLLCTSTLIEGVNTKAKNVIIFDNKVAREKFDYFTFNNICGRSGRMFQHFIGKVFLFHEPPQEELPMVDFPIFSQLDDVSEKLLIQLEEEDLTDNSKDRLKSIRNNNSLSLKTIRLNSNIDPFNQIKLAEEINNKLQYYATMLNWNGFPPKYEHLELICNLIWNYLVDHGKGVGGVKSASQLTFKIHLLTKHKELIPIINSELKNKTDAEEINESIETVLEFTRYWAQYNFPKYLLALDRIQREVLSKNGFATGDYSYFASQLECLFTNPLFIALDEYGIPIQTSKRLSPYLNLTNSSNLDDLLKQLKALNLSALKISIFEKDLISDSRRFF
ncbi:DEAD/DEAH box helicase [Cytophagaceae bacterium YF14B1]|uniref:DEAD/DEAH box helicase n=1 Tax=Xanthocytophaga flava TaxID=3048013 RepID=A0AAE3QX10_9BACT|nr:DEAD/DEAH box helicase [Xanthocytophaga flavus]MDJ1484329.1 DEAD/DEAH box helicase [Xanthocytophaga flavus]